VRKKTTKKVTEKIIPTFIIKTNTPITKEEHEGLVQIVTEFTGKNDMYLDDALEPRSGKKINPTFIVKTNESISGSGTAYEKYAKAIAKFNAENGLYLFYVVEERIGVNKKHKKDKVTTGYVMTCPDCKHMWEVDVKVVGPEPFAVECPECGTDVGSEHGVALVEGK